MASPIKATQSSIGANIRAIRKTRGYTIDELTERITALTGDEHSPKTVGTWERGTKMINAVEMFEVAQALGTSVESLYLYQYTNSKDLDLMEVSSAFRNLSIEDQRILAYSIVQFEGDIHAMIQSVGMYCAMYNDDRELAIGQIVTAYKIAVAEGKVRENAPQCDTEYVEEQWERLLKG